MHVTCQFSDPNIGIGLGLTSSLLLRPNTTVVATVRSKATPTDDLKSLPMADCSKLIIQLLSSTSDTSAASLIDSLPTESITHIDTVIANAGSGTSFEPAVTTFLTSLRDDFEVNTLGPIKLFQAVYPLLKESLAPKFILISSILGSIGSIGESPSLSYGVSKAAANYLARKVHIEHAEISALAIHPGYVSILMKRERKLMHMK
jgi:norsolorinic acid ketoreductase